jgi:4-hydroxy-tetrahydrodipicolinate reductase
MKKLNIFVHGSSGKMGQNVMTILQRMKSVSVVYDLKSAHVCIDFSSSAGVTHLLKQIKGSRTALISGTTGLTEKQFQQLKKVSGQRAVLWSSNFSPGLWAVRSALKSFGSISEFDFSINEIHHTEKLDNPSGTALTLQKDLENAVGKRIAKPVGQRLGGVFGIHTITAGSKNELIRLEHTAMNRTVFAQGAVDSAVWIVNQASGYYSMDDFMTLSTKGRLSLRTKK